jgi:cell division protein FtsZ
MIEYTRDPQSVIPTSSVKIVGLGGAGANMLDRVVLDGMEGAEMLALNTDIRTLSGSVARERIQLGRNLTKGLGTGGDPELGQQAVLEAEDEVRAALKGRKIIFICVGLGGGTGSGAAPIVARLAREEGAFVVVFATMPFIFEGRRRREQADSALNELAVLSNALVTFDNNRMGELVLAKQGIHEAFSAGDRMISESIKAVIRLVIRPGLIHVGLDELMSALRTTRSRCLFGSGISSGKDRAAKALRNALSSPLLDQGSLLKDAESVLVHLCGGEDLTLFEIETLMQNLSKYVPEKAHVLFGAAVDPAMGEHLSITLVSALPEDRLHSRPSGYERTKLLGDEEPAPVVGKSAAKPLPEIISKAEPKQVEIVSPPPVPQAVVVEPIDDAPAFTVKTPVQVAAKPAEPKPVAVEITPEEPVHVPQAEAIPEVVEDEPPFLIQDEAIVDEPEEHLAYDDEPELPEDEDPFLSTYESRSAVLPEPEEDFASPSFVHKQPEPQPEPVTPPPTTPSRRPSSLVEDFMEPESEPEASAKQARSRPAKADPQAELSFDGGPRGRFEASSPSLFEGEDLDVPAFLRKKRN